ncbi:MAG: UDP-N-acetylmuramate:L-alanyl-gamma-D-glutamyl-meso-diaminopimelate ligase [Myxococcales bacterium]|nr:UDP-N-acetylmuramate:L-alanyl-gamma-D-glutamyl-meso-diaminopimelate ligase [Myxococcales bacterium]
MPLLTGPLPFSPPGVGVTPTLHIMGIGGTAMAALAGMLKDTGYRVTGSDTGVYPPMSTYLESLGIPVMIGYNAANIAADRPGGPPDLVVVGNVIRAEYEEARALLASDLPYCSFPQLLGAMFLERRQSIVVAGTHGKTTTTSLIAHLVDHAMPPAKKPGFLVGGLAKNFDRTARLGDGPHFVIEGDEYDTAFFDKGPKFLHYRPNTAIITSVEFDHADIYRDLDHVKESFRRLVAIVPPAGPAGEAGGGCIVARWDHDNVVDVCQGAGPEIRRYGVGQQWDGRIDRVDTQRGVQHFTVLKDGGVWGRFECILVGEYNLYNCVAACAALDREGLTAADLAPGFSSFAGVKRRQEVVGEVRQVTVLDDFAHHPTAVDVTLSGLRLRFGNRRIWAIFEPRSATSRRAVFQEAYAQVFSNADIVVVAPPPDQGRIAEDERFDTPRLIKRLRDQGKEAFSWDSVDEIVAAVCANALPHDVIAVLSNGAFGGIHGKLVRGLER